MDTIALLCARLALVAPLAAVGCHRAPDEPRAPTPTAPARPPEALAPVGQQAARIALALADGGLPESLTAPVRLELPLPTGVDVVAARSRGAWVVAALEADRVTTGITGAERVLTRWRDQGHSPSAIELAQLVGAFAYYPLPVFVRHERLAGAGDSGAVIAPGATLASRPGGTGRSLTFAYRIPVGPGEGVHVAHFNVTDSNLIIDEAPNPALR